MTAGTVTETVTRIQAAHRQPRRDRGPDHPHRAGHGHRHRRGVLRPRRRAALRRRRPTRPCGCPAPRRPTPTCAATRSSPRPPRPAPTPCTPATASCPRTPASPGPAPTAGLIFVGPPPEAIEAMGSKIAAKELMAAAGVPVLPGAVVDDAAEPDPAEVRRAAAEIGFPVLVKAAFGGGGRGMRVVAAPASWSRRSPPPAGRRRPRSVTAPCSSSGSWRRPATSRCRSSATGTARSCTCSSASARSSAATRRSSRRRRRRRSTTGCGPSCAGRRWRRARPSATSARAPSSSCSTPTAASASSRSTPGCRSSTRSPSWSPASTSSGCSCEVAAGQPLPPGTGAHARRARDRGPALRRGRRPPATCRRAARCTASRSARPPGVRVDAGFDDGSSVSTFYDAMLAKVIGCGPTPGRRAARAGRAPWPAPGCTASPPTATCSSASCASRSSGPAPSTPASSTGTRRASSAGDADRRRAVHLLAAALAGQAERRRHGAGARHAPVGLAQRPERGPAGQLRRRRPEPAEVRYQFGRDGLRAEVDGERAAGRGAARGHARAGRPGGRRRAAGRRACTGSAGSATSTARSGHSALTELDRFPDPAAAERPGRCWRRCPAPWSGSRSRWATPSRQECRSWRSRR